MKLLTGEYKNTLDDKGRVSLPSRLREDLAGTVLRLTKDMDNDCLQLIPLEEWDKYADSLALSLAASLAERLNDPVSRLAKERQRLRYRIIAPSREVELDRIGRISIPPDLREFAGLSLGKECIIMGLGTYIEIWDIRRFEAFCQDGMGAPDQTPAG